MARNLTLSSSPLIRFPHCSSCTRIMGSIFLNPNKNTPFYNEPHVRRRFTSINPATSLPAILNSRSPNTIRWSCVFPLYPFYRSCSPSLKFSVMSQNNDTDTTPQDSSKTVRCVIKGRVQGVFYRNWTIENASQLDLKGWVRNRRDGSVEALFSGKTEAVDEMQQRCRRGPPDAMVTAFQAHPCNDDPGTAFERRPTV